MKRALIDAAKTYGRPLKRALQAMIDNRLVDYHMPPSMPGDLLLTFDDGPHPEYTPPLLDLLDEYNARAVFFVIGEQAERRLDLVQACRDKGHFVANHTYTHLNDAIGGRYTRSRVAEEIGKCSDLVQHAIGRATDWFRPPRGELNAKTWAASRDTNHRIMLWSIEGGEAGSRCDWSADEISDYVSGNIRKRDILLLHDNNEKTFRVTSDLLAKLRREKFDLVSAAASLD
jgi:peptidoglycan-N-acetylglucosamine deacetylase